MKRICKKLINLLLTALSLALLCVGWIGWDAGLKNLDGPLVKYKYTERIALGNGSVQVDQRDRLYVYSHFYGRIQVFDSKGQFLYSLGGFGNRTRVGLLTYALDRDNRLQVTVGETSWLFDAEGNLLDSATAFLPSPFNNSDQEGNYYRVQNGWFYPRIIKVQPNNTRVTVISTPFWEWARSGPLPAFIWMLLGVGGFVVFSFEWLKGFFTMSMFRKGR